MLDQRLLSIGIAGLLLIHCSFAVAGKVKNKMFEELTIETPFLLSHPVIAADILPASGKEILAFGVDDDEKRWLGVYTVDTINNQHVMAAKVVIPDEFSRFDLSDHRSDRLQSLYFMSANRLFVFNPDISTEPFKPLAEIDSIFLKDDPQFLRNSKFVHRLSAGDVDDILIPGFSQMTIVSIADKNVVTSQSLAVKPLVNLSSDGASFNQRKFYISDTNFDQLRDLVLVGDGELMVYAQDQAGKFSNKTQTLAIDRSISGIEWWNKRDAMGNQLDQSDLIYRKLEQLRDINDDGISDMIVRLTKSEGVLDRSNDYEVYLGKNVAGQLSFSTISDSVIRADGTLTGFQFVDVDNDKKMEVLLAGFDIGLTQIIGALLSGSIDQDVFLFKMDKQGNFSAKPNSKKEVELNFSIRSGQSGQPVVKLADINGDGLKDLVLSDGDNLLRLYLGGSGKRMFAKRSKKYRTKLPKEGDVMHVDDINGDGKDDLLLKYGRLDHSNLQRTFKIYLSTAM